MKKFIALVPAYEPEELMTDLLVRLSENGFETVVIDDGSGESFSSLFEKAKQYATVLTHPQNKGKGCAIKTGLAHIKETCGEDCIVVTVDADGQHKVEDAKKLCELVSEFPDTLYLGSRRLEGKIPLRSRFGNSMTRLVYRISTGLKVHDTQTGLRAFDGTLIERMQKIRGDRYEYEMNVLLELAREKTPIKEMEIETIYLNNNAASHFNPFRDSLRVYKEILKFSASSFIGFLVDYVIYTLLFLLTDKLMLSNVCARIVSSTVNFTINRKFVFKSDKSLLRSAVEYFLLAAVILVGNTALLGLLVSVCRRNGMLAKIITEIVFFIISWSAQRFIVFRKRKKN